MLFLFWFSPCAVLLEPRPRTLPVSIDTRGHVFATQVVHHCVFCWRYLCSCRGHLELASGLRFSPMENRMYNVATRLATWPAVHINTKSLPIRPRHRMLCDIKTNDTPSWMFYAIKWLTYPPSHVWDCPDQRIVSVLCAIFKRWWRQNRTPTNLQRMQHQKFKPPRDVGVFVSKNIYQMNRFDPCSFLVLALATNDHFMHILSFHTTAATTAATPHTSFRKHVYTCAFQKVHIK